MNIATKNFIDKIITKTKENSTCKILNKKLTPLKEWMTIGLVQSIRKREILAKKLKNNPSNTILQNEYKQYKKKL